MCHFLRPPSRGFTLVELIGVIAGCGMVALAVLVQYTDRRDQARESALRANLEVIRTAIERYHTDAGYYPEYLLGGDAPGWDHWHHAFDEPAPASDKAQNAWLHDPLLRAGYLIEYPKNPFVDSGRAVLLQTGPADGQGQPGSGDPRFGLHGDRIGNGVDDPAFFRNWWDIPAPHVETFRTQLSRHLPVEKLSEWSMGGRRGLDQAGRLHTIPTHWPGHFFYRGARSIWVPRKGWLVLVPGSWYRGEVNAFVAGVFGDYSSSGSDLIRLESTDPTGQQLYYRSGSIPPHPMDILPLGFRKSEGWGTPTPTGLPELTGGGNAWFAPHFPSNWSPASRWKFLLGAPDGHPDGVLEVIHSPEGVPTW